MLSLGSALSRTCGGLSRRGLLQLGALTGVGFHLPRLLAAEAALPPEQQKRFNCILLWMGGGASNIDTFDMKPNAPVEIRGEFQSINTNLGDFRICEHLPRMATQMDKLCLLRSVSHSESGDHVAAVHYMQTGYPQRPDPTGQPPGALIYPAYGAVVSRELGWQNGMPPYVVMTGKPAPYTGAGYMGSAYNPLAIRNDPNDPKFSVEDVTIPEVVGPERTARRRQMLAALDDWQRRTETSAARGAVADRGQFYQQAFDLITSPAAKRAFRLDEEPDSVRDRYGRMRNGQAALLARRLIESGVRFVSVETHWWDTHQDNFKSLRDKYLPDLDQWWSALMEDLEQRGLLETTLVIWMGEFGRTPRVNGQAGRDHWAWANSICLSGAGVKMGTVFGETDRNCERPAGTTHTTHDYAATIYKLLGIDASQEYLTPDGRPVLINYHGTPIREILA